MAKNREFDFNNEHFELVRKLVTEHTGIMVTDAKQDMVYSRLVRRIRQTGSENFDQYCQLLSTDSEEFTPFINALTTNLTSFFRENHHFEMLADSVL
ncbi:MAG: chemotaxis protein CheR, partial [Gammaproteobacteria bacterium]|nr:chemotaxis protein CheR [Gammaproteobacteria bacterium]